MEDDIIAVNQQIVVGWSSENILKLLESAFSSGTVWLVLRKMPKDHLSSIKQQKNLVFIYKNLAPALREKQSKPALNGGNTHKRKHSFSDILDLRFVLNLKLFGFFYLNKDKNNKYKCFFFLIIFDQ